MSMDRDTFMGDDQDYQHKKSLRTSRNGQSVKPQDWRIAYERSDGKRTGRWCWVNERGEQDRFYPGRWLNAGEFCDPPRATP